MKTGNWVATDVVCPGYRCNGTYRISCSTGEGGSVCRCFETAGERLLYMRQYCKDDYGSCPLAGLNGGERW